MADKYNGWTNYETWDVALWLGNDEYLDNQARVFVRAALQRYDSISRAGDALSEWVDEMADELYPSIRSGASMFTDLLGHALGMVDWREIAEHYQQDLIESGELTTDDDDSDDD